MELTDPKDYNHATSGRKNLDTYKAAYDTAKKSESIDANTDELEDLIRSTNSKLSTIDSHIDGVEAELSALNSKLTTVLGKLDTAITHLETIATNTTPEEPEA